MSAVVSIIDYGVGNLFSVARAVEKAGGEPRLVSRFAEVRSADRIVLPGVGAFEPCMTSLEKTGLADAVREYAERERPFLGICVGMQLLFDRSFEFGLNPGLGLIPGQVTPIKSLDENGERKVPHIGWSRLLVPDSREDWTGTVLHDMPNEAATYFVHSFNCEPEDETVRLADARYEGTRICAAVAKDSITAFQCHPEKSGPIGLRIFENFLTM